MKKLTVSILALLSLALLTGCAGHREEASHSDVSSIQAAFSDKGRTLTAHIPTNESEFISAEDAKSIAFNHAGVHSGDAYKIEIEFDGDDQIPHYDISFKSGDVKFEYEVHARTGAVLDLGQETEKERTTVNTAPISKEQAKAIALVHAGVQEVNIQELAVELDQEKAKVVYEIDFHSGTYEYEYEIDAISGAILKFERDR